MMWKANKGAIAKYIYIYIYIWIDPFKFSDQVEITKLIPSKYAYVGNLYPFVLVGNGLFTYKLKTIRRKKKKKEYFHS